MRSPRGSHGVPPPRHAPRTPRRCACRSGCARPRTGSSGIGPPAPRTRRAPGRQPPRGRGHRGRQGGETTGGAGRQRGDRRGGGGCQPRGVGGQPTISRPGRTQAGGPVPRRPLACLPADSLGQLPTRTHHGASIGLGHDAPDFLVGVRVASRAGGQVLDGVVAALAARAGRRADGGHGHLGDSGGDTGRASAGTGRNPVSRTRRRHRATAWPTQHSSSAATAPSAPGSSSRRRRSGAQRPGRQAPGQSHCGPKRSPGAPGRPPPTRRAPPQTAGVPPSCPRLVEGAWQALPRGQSQCLVLTSPLRRIWSASAERISMEESQAHGEAQAPDEGASRWWQALRASARQAASELLDPALLAAATDTAKDLSELASRKATVLGTLVLDKAHQARELASENLPVLEELAREKVHQAQGLALRAGELASTVGGVALESASGLVDELSARLACVPLHSPAAHPSVALTEARQPRRAGGPAARHAADHGRRRRRAACSSCGCDGRLEALCERPGRGGLPARGQVDKLARRRRRCAQPAAVGGGPQGSCAHPLPGAS